MNTIENGKEYTISVKENGDKFWYHKNKLHREAGPAIELAAGYKAWYFEGKKVICNSQKEFEKSIQILKTAVQKKYYDVKVECTLPATLQYRVFANSPEEAVSLIKNMQPISVKHKLIGKKEIKIMVYDSGSTILKYIKNLLGI